MKSIGRRNGHAVEKQVLDVLSFEARAAFHQCYSAVWCDLLPHLARKYDMDEKSQTFHRFWHLQQREPSDDPKHDFYLFHGHMFALHSAAGDFVSTKTGAELMGQWLTEGGDGPAFRRLLHGLLVAMHDYARRMQLQSILRKKTPDSSARCACCRRRRP